MNKQIPREKVRGQVDQLDTLHLKLKELKFGVVGGLLIPHVHEKLSQAVSDFYIKGN